MKKILLCILGFFIIILQNSIINYLSVFGMTINIVLIYLVIISLYLDELESGIIGAVLGIILDSSVGGLFGSNGLIFFGVALKLATQEEIDYIRAQTLKINEIMKEFFLKMDLKLVDFKLEFGKDADGNIILADEISPDTCRLWDVNTNEKLDKDRFRRDLGDLVQGYEEVLSRMNK